MFGAQMVKKKEKKTKSQVKSDLCELIPKKMCRGLFVWLVVFSVALVVVVACMCEKNNAN